MNGPGQDIRYPIGLPPEEGYSEGTRDAFLTLIRDFPIHLDQVVSKLPNELLHIPYRVGGWTPHQIIHHLADSHMNAYIRCKLCLTEVNPTIKPYDENTWVTTEDVKNVSVTSAMNLLHPLHTRWYSLLASASESDFAKTIYHPERERTISLWELLTYYAWHGRHHASHILQLSANSK